MIEKIASRVAFSIKSANPENTASIEVMKFSLMIVLNTLSIILLSLIIGGVTGKFTETGIALLAFAILKYFSGGIHLNSSDYCVIWSTATMVLIPHTPIFEQWSVWMTLVSLMIVLFFAPANMHKKAKVPESFYPLLKIISFAIVGSNFILQSDLLAKVFLVQALMLLPYKKEGEK